MGVSVRSLGCWLVDRDVRLPANPRLEYRGLDRLLSAPGPGEDDQLRTNGRSRLVEIRDRYWELDDSGELQRRVEVARDLRHEFESEGVAVEIVFAELEIPDVRDVPDDLQRAFERNLTRWSIEAPPEIGAAGLGFDVVFPFPSFHSAIRQPVLGTAQPDFVDHLNEYGLFPAIDLARSAADVCNRRDTAWRPFCPVAVSRVD